MINIPKSLAADQLPLTNLQPVKVDDSISLVTYKLAGDSPLDSDYVYQHERLGKVVFVYEDGSFLADMESISGKKNQIYTFTTNMLASVLFDHNKMAHVLHNLSLKTNTIH